MRLVQRPLEPVTSSRKRPKLERSACRPLQPHPDSAANHRIMIIRVRRTSTWIGQHVVWPYHSTSIARQSAQNIKPHRHAPHLTRSLPPLTSSRLLVACAEHQPRSAPSTNLVLNSAPGVGEPCPLTPKRTLPASVSGRPTSLINGTDQQCCGRGPRSTLVDLVDSRSPLLDHTISLRPHGAAEF